MTDLDSSEEPRAIAGPANFRDGAVLVLASLAGGNDSLAALASTFATPAAITFGQRVAEELRGIRSAQAAAVPGVAAHLRAEDPERLLDYAMTDPARRQLTHAAMMAGADAITASKIAGLGRALAEGLSDDDAKVDSAFLVVKALADLEPAHVRLLAQLERDSWRGPQWIGEPVDRAILVVLERHGLVMDDVVERQNLAFRALAEHQVKQNELSVINPRQVAKLRPIPGDTMAGFTVPDIRPRWSITPFGSMCLDYLGEHSLSPDGSGPAS